MVGQLIGALQIFSRTMTLAEGYGKCDFRRKKEILVAARLMPQLTIRQFGPGEFIVGREPNSKELALARAGWTEIRAVVASGQ